MNGIESRTRGCLPPLPPSLPPSTSVSAQAPLLPDPVAHKTHQRHLHAVRGEAQAGNQEEEELEGAQANQILS